MSAPIDAASSRALACGRGEAHARDGAAQGINLSQLCLRARHQFCDLFLHDVGAREQILIFKKIGFIGEDLLKP